MAKEGSEIAIDLEKLWVHSWARPHTIVEAHQWHRNGDHPADGPRGSEGAVVRYFRRPDQDGDKDCYECGNLFVDHGWIDDGTPDGDRVCPGDWILRDAFSGKVKVLHPEEFEEIYRSAAVDPSVRACTCCAGPAPYIDDPPAEDTAPPLPTWFDRYLAEHGIRSGDVCIPGFVPIVPRTNSPETDELVFIARDIISRVDLERVDKNNYHCHAQINKHIETREPGLELMARIAAHAYLDAARMGQVDVVRVAPSERECVDVSD